MRRAAQPPPGMVAATTAAIAAPYGPYDAVVGAALTALAEAASAAGQVSLTREHIGESVEGRPIEAITCRSDRSAPPLPEDLEAPSRRLPRVLVVANLHGLEHIGVHVALGVLWAVVLGPAAMLLQRCELVVVPSANPDAYAATLARGGRGTVASLRCNAHGVDLNRNFPRPGGDRPSRLPFTGSDRPGRATYRGPAPLSEPESRALATLLARGDVAAVFSLHSFMGRLILPCTRSPSDHKGYAQLTAAFRRAQAHARYPTLASRRFDVFTGELEDHVHHVHDAWALCVETFSVRASLRQHLRAPSPFWRFNPRDAARWVENDAAGVLAAAALALDLGPPSRRRDRAQA